MTPHVRQRRGSGAAAAQQRRGSGAAAAYLEPTEELSLRSREYSSPSASPAASGSKSDEPIRDCMREYPVSTP